MNLTSTQIWLIILLIGLGTFLIRFSFIGLVGNRKYPDWLIRHLRYTPVAVLPGLVAPLVLWPSATGGETEPVRLVAALTTFAVGYVSKNVILAMVAGAAVLLTGLTAF